MHHASHTTQHVLSILMTHLTYLIKDDVEKFLLAKKGKTDEQTAEVCLKELQAQYG